jgi:signal peptidase II
VNQLSPARLGQALAIAVIALDQLTKWWMLAVVMVPPRLIDITPFFNLVMVMNPGASFGLFAEAPGWMPWVLTGFALVISLVLLIWLRRTDNRLLAAALGLVLGGALGNVVDRVRFGAVVDFLDFHAAGVHWPAFNVADGAITIGVGLLILDALKSNPNSP